MQIRILASQFVCFFVIVLAAAAPAFAAITFNITYNDVVNDTNIGFDDPTFGATRQATIASMTSYLNSVLDHNGTIDLTVNNSQPDGTGFLASSGPAFFTSPNGFKNGFAFEHATTGIDPLGSFHDASATFDFGYSWNSGTGTPGGSEYDLFSVALHEFTHSLGFLSLVTSAGVSSISGGDPGVFSVYNSFLERGDGTDLFGPGGNFLGTAADLISNDVFFNGANATAANGGNRVQVYAPGTFASGSSISHIQGVTGAVMQSSIGLGVQRRAYTAQELGILQDIGWTMQSSSVPEPSSLALILIAGTVIGGARWRKRKAAVPQEPTPTSIAA